MVVAFVLTTPLLIVPMLPPLVNIWVIGGLDVILIQAAGTVTLTVTPTATVNLTVGEVIVTGTVTRMAETAGTGAIVAARLHRVVDATHLIIDVVGVTQEVHPGAAALHEAEAGAETMTPLLLPALQLQRQLIPLVGEVIPERYAPEFTPLPLCHGRVVSKKSKVKGKGSK